MAWLLDWSRHRIDDSRTGNSLCAGHTHRECTVIGNTDFQFDAEVFTRTGICSRFISEGQVFDYLPDSALSQVENVGEFAGVFALDKWLCNCDGRQVVFCRIEPKRGFRAHFIDFGFCFNAGEWSFPDSVSRGIYANKAVYREVCGWESFEPWLSRIESFPLTTLWAIAAEVPPEWVELDTLSQLVECINIRRSRLRELIAAARQSQRNPFDAWTEDKP